MTFNQLKRITHKTFAGFMAIWLSGVVFLVVCNLQMANASGGDHCPLVKLGAHCDKVDKNKNSHVVTDRTNENGMDCCAFIPALFDKSRTIDSNQQVAAVAPIAIVERPKQIAVQPLFTRNCSYHSTILPKGDTFLKNRTFRI